MKGLPQGWALATLSDLGDWSSGGTPSRSNSKYFGGDIPFVKTGDLRDETLTQVEETLTASGLANSSAKIFPAGTLLIAMYGATIWRTARLAFNAATNQACAALLENEANADSIDFVWKYLRSQTETLKAAGKGGAQPNISQTVLKQYPIPLPPLPEQRRIVRKLDTLSARTTTARTHLTAIEKLVERYKRLVIGQLCLGGVAAQFQDQGDLPALPIGWGWSRAEDLCHWITKGTTPAKGELFSDVGDVPFIKVYNLTFSERLDFSINPTFVSSRTHDVALKRSKLFPGDVLINIVGPPLGKTAIVPDSFPEWNMNQAIAVFRPKERLFNRFLLYWLSSEWFLSWALSRSKATAGQRNLTLEICRDTPVPLPSFDEQREIVRRIETAFEKIDRLAAEAAKALKLVGHLDQRILAKAFAGELVPQDPTDEPAETLLARIRTARDAAPKAKRRRRTSA